MSSNVIRPLLFQSPLRISQPVFEVSSRPNEFGIMSLKPYEHLGRRSPVGEKDRVSVEGMANDCDSRVRGTSCSIDIRCGNSCEEQSPLPQAGRVTLDSKLLRQMRLASRISSEDRIHNHTHPSCSNAATRTPRHAEREVGFAYLFVRGLTGILGYLHNPRSC